jgi:hypothetical protein
MRMKPQKDELWTGYQKREINRRRAGEILQQINFLGLNLSGAEAGDPRYQLQPLLPGSVVGECSMQEDELADKITEVGA